LEKDRFLSVINLLDAVWTRSMNTRFERKHTAQALLDLDNGKDYIDFALKMLAESLESSQYCRVYLSDHYHGQVHSFPGNSYIVDLTKPTFTCGRFQVNDIPCGHAIAYLRKLNQAPRHHIPEFSA